MPAGGISGEQRVRNATFDRMLVDAHLTNVQAALPKFCWEEGVSGDIFGSNSSSLPNMLNVVLPQPDDVRAAEPSATLASARILKRKFDSSFYASSVKVISDKGYIEQQHHVWASALCEWESNFCIVNHQGPVGEAVWNAATSTDSGVLSLTCFQPSSACLLRCITACLDRRGENLPSSFTT